MALIIKQGRENSIIYFTVKPNFHLKEQRKERRISNKIKITLVMSQHYVTCEEIPHHSLGVITS